MQKIDNSHKLYQRVFPKDFLDKQKQSPELFVQGSSKHLKKFIASKKPHPVAAIIGSRKITLHTMLMLEYFVEFFCIHNCTILSGGATGVDSYAHKACLKYNGFTACFLAQPISAKLIDSKQLYGQISKRGILISAQQPLSPTFKYSFLKRNQLLVHLADFLFVPQADINSGTIQTAIYALQIGKAVFVLPASLYDSPYAGNLELIKAGATMLSCLSDLFDILKIDPLKHQGFLG